MDRGDLLQMAQLSDSSPLPRMITGNHVDGLLIIGRIDVETAGRLEGLPVVTIGGGSVYDFHNITADGEMAGYQVAIYLLELGHKNIGLIAGSCHPARLSSRILEGFK